MNRIEKALKLRQRVNLGLSAAIESGAVDAKSAQEIAETWKAGRAYAAGEAAAYGGKLYRCAQAHTAQGDWTPPAVPALWAYMGVSADDPAAVPEWVQPAGAHDAYAKGSTVTHNGQTYVSDIDANVYEPGVYGWTVAA